MSASRQVSTASLIFFPRVLETWMSLMLEINFPYGTAVLIIPGLKELGAEWYGALLVP